jgi:cbb3-type cytochrome oxidase maturation protein
MSIIYVALPISLLLVAAAVVAFVWAARRGQFDDLDTPALRVVHDHSTARASAAPAAKPSAGAGTRAIGPEGDGLTP